MDFLYKINSSYDGFTPRQLPKRVKNGRLTLQWRKYLDSVGKGDCVWLYFQGPHNFNRGVYAKGRVSSVSYKHENIKLRLTTWRDASPITDFHTTKHIARIVQKKYQQVFPFLRPKAGKHHCDLFSPERQSCVARKCGYCRTWKSLPRIRPGDNDRPQTLPDCIKRFWPAYWVIPRQTYRRRSLISESIKTVSELFYDFKMGETNLSYFFARGIYEQIVKSNTKEIECIVPIPLSPDKKRKREFHRTLSLAKELSKLLGVKCFEALKLVKPISKRRYEAEGKRNRFQKHYQDRLKIAKRIRRYGRILIVDDVCTNGTTLNVVSECIKEFHPKCELLAATAGQMMLKGVLLHPSHIR
jgi:predicted amidophosphoribosyltransferase